MAITVEEISTIQIGALPGRVRLFGRAEVTGVDDTFTINPGNNTTNFDGPIPSVGLRHIDRWGFIHTALEVRTLQVSKSYSAATDNEYLTVVGLPNNEYYFWVEGEYSGE